MQVKRLSKKLIQASTPLSLTFDNQLIVILSEVEI